MSEEFLEHHPLGASASDRWLECPGSYHATKDLPDRDTDYSIEGTAAHSLSEMARQHGRPVRDYVGVNIPVKLVDGSFKEIEATKDMADHVQGFVDYLEALPGDDYNEARVHWHSFVPGAFGTMDAAKAENKHVHIVDLKFGQGVQVYAKENSQLMLYALGFWEAHGWLYNIESFSLHVYQPRLDHVDVWPITLEALLTWARDVMAPGAERAMQPGAPFKSGDHCTFCKLKANCVTRAKAVFEMNLDELDDLDAAVSKDVPAVQTLTAAQKAKILRRKSEVTSFYSALEADVKAEIKAGRPVGDYKFVAGRKSRSFTDEGKAKELALALDVPEEELYEPADFKSVAKVEKLVGKSKFKAFGEIVRTTDGKPTLVPGDDGRPALDLNLVAEMEDLDDAA